MVMKVRVEHVPTDSITPSADNPRRHPRSQIRQLSKAIRDLGFINPIIIDQDGIIVAGHARHQVAIELGLEQVPTIMVDHLNKHQLRLYRLADNKLCENGEWDPELLAIDLKLLIEHEFDMEITGFSAPEIDLVLQSQPVSTLEDPPASDPEDINSPVVIPGDVFQLGPHRILCGDIRNQITVQQFLGDIRADAVFTDPPFNVPIAGHVSGLGKHTHAEFAMASGEMDSFQFTEFLRTSLGNLVRVSRNGAVHFVCMDWRHLAELYAAAVEIYNTQLNLCVWSKSNGGMGSLYRSQHELIGVYRVGSEPHLNNVELGKHDRYRTNVWSYAGQNAFGAKRDEDLALHPTVKPIPLIADALLDVTSRGDHVLDGFLGSGSTLLAAEQIGRIAYGIEIDPRYIEVTLQRWFALTGEEALHELSGMTLSELRAQRLANFDSEED
jgi:DNA modification methylase